MERVIRVSNSTTVLCTDEPSHGGACHSYEVKANQSEPFQTTVVGFQNGPIKEFGINGCQNEDLIAIVIDRLQHFQKGQFSCRENAIALTKLEEALLWLDKRTADRKARNVEGLNKA